MKCSTRIIAIAGFVLAGFVGKAGESAPSSEPAKGAAPAELKQKLEASRARWNEAKKASGGNYEYVARFHSYSGFGWECTVVVRNNEVVERIYTTFNRTTFQSVPPETWIEHGLELGRHGEGIPPRTMDEIYDEADRILGQPAGGVKPKWIYSENSAGLLLECGWMDAMIADDIPLNGIRLAEIRMQSPDKK